MGDFPFLILTQPILCSCNLVWSQLSCALLSAYAATSLVTRTFRYSFAPEGYFWMKTLMKCVEVHPEMRGPSVGDLCPACGCSRSGSQCGGWLAFASNTLCQPVLDRLLSQGVGSPRRGTMPSRGGPLVRLGFLTSGSWEAFKGL